VAKWMRWLRGSVRLEIQGAAPTAFLNACAEADIPFRDTETVDACTLRCTLNRSALPKTEQLGLRSLCSVKLLHESGAPKLLRSLRKRYALLAGAALCCGALLWSSFYVWEIEIVGNERASETEILTALHHAGVSIGSFWPDFTNEKIKCRVLSEVPELSWLGVNVHGSRAIVSVRERVETPVLYTEKTPTLLEAAKGGLITEVQALQGTALVKKGQTVLPGEVLVSELMESSFEKAQPRHVHARGKVMARTWYSLSAAAPLERTEKVYTGRVRRGIALEIGKRRINLYNLADNSRNSGVEYDKITKTYRLALQSVFTTPLALTAERWNAYEIVSVPADKTLLTEELEAELTARLARAIGEEGSVLASEFSAEERDGMLYVTLRAECMEDIARERAVEENGEGDTSQLWTES